MTRTVRKFLASLACGMGAALLLANSVMGAAPPADVTLVDWDQPWFYLAPPSVSQNPDQGFGNFDVFTDEWFLPGFDVSSPISFGVPGTELTWAVGPGPIQYEQTANTSPVDYISNNFPTFTSISPAPVSGDRYTVYFRSTFNVPAGAPSPNWIADTVVDDSAVWFIDGTEVTTMRTAAVTGDVPLYEDLSGGGSETTLVSYSIPALPAGDHTIAVAVHQTSVTSSDLGMAFRLVSPGSARVWTSDASASWHDDTRWRGNDVATLPSEYALFGSAYNTNHSIWLDQDVSLDGIQFDNVFTYNIGGSGTITLQGNGRDASLNAVNGWHQIQTPVRLGRNTDMNIDGTYEVTADPLLESPVGLTLRNMLNLNGRTMTKVGSGELLIMSRASSGTSGTLRINEGSLAGDGIVQGNVVVGAAGTVYPTGFSTGAGAEGRAAILGVAGTANFESGSNLTFRLYGDNLNDKLNATGGVTFSGATVNVVFDETAYTPASGATFDLVDGTISGPMPTFNIQAVAGLTWNTNNFMADGTITLGGGVVGNPLDFNGDDLVDVADINLLTRAGNLVAGVNPGDAGYDAKYDLTMDNVINGADLAKWREDAATAAGFSEPYLLGDTDLNGRVEFADFVNMNNNWQQTMVSGQSVAWQFGDFDGNGVVEFADFVAQNNNWQRVQASGAAAAAVPEPAGLALIGMGLLGLAARRRRS